MSPVERLPFAIESLADFTELRRRFTSMPMVPKIMASQAVGVDISSPGRQSQTLLVGEETSGAMYATDVYLMSGFGAPPHHQPTEEELWYLVDGEMDVRVGTQAATIRTGAFAFIPRNTTHTFKNNRSSPARLLAWDSPGGHERAFEAMRKKSEEGVVEFSALRQMFAIHGVQMHADPGEVAENDHLIGSHAQKLPAKVRTREDFERYRAALGALPRIPKLLAGREQAPDLSWVGTSVRLLLESEQCAGQFNVADIILDPGCGMPTHRRHATDQCVYALGENLELTVANESRQVGPGAFAFIPRNTPSKISNTGEVSAHFLHWNMPGGQEPVYDLLHERQSWDALTRADRQLLEACDFILD